MPADAPLRARLGEYGKAVHVLEQCRERHEPSTSYWGASICGRAGEARLTDEPVTCGECRRRMCSK